MHSSLYQLFNDTSPSSVDVVLGLKYIKKKANELR